MKPTYPQKCVSMSFIAAIVAGILTLTAGCRKEYIVHETHTPAIVPAAAITGFWFAPDQNPDFLHEQVNLEINGNNISGRIPYYSDIKSLKPSFTSTGEKVVVEDEVQLNGKTSQDFRLPVKYHVMGNNNAVTAYSVNVINFTGLPVLKINTQGGSPITSKDIYVKGTLSFDGVKQSPDVEVPLQIKGRGNSTWGLPKKPYKLKLGSKQSFFGAPAHKTWVLLANYADKSQLRTDLAFAMGTTSNLAWTPAAQHVELFLNEVYQGTYQLCESIEVDPKRVNVTDNGFLLEVDQLDRMEAGDVYFNTPKILVNIKGPELVKDDARYNFIKNYVVQAENALYSANFTDPESGYTKYLDVESFVDWFIINEISKNNDAIFYSSCYMNLAPGGKLKMGPIWDFDIAFGNANYNDNHNVEGFWVKQGPWMSRLFADPVFVGKVKQRFQFFKSNKEKFLTTINTNAAKLKWSAIENNNRWKTLYTEIWPNYAVWGSYDNEVMYLKNWVNNRIAWLEGAINAL